MNTRLQVEHPVSEYVGQVDLVEQMIRVAAGERIRADLTTESVAANIQGWAMEGRVYAEDPLRNFLPSNGSLLSLREPSGATAFNIDAPVRVDSGLMEGMAISTHYDPMIAKLVTYGKTRAESIDRMAAALDEYVIRGSAGFSHNTSFLQELCRSPRFRRGETPTSFIPEEYPDGFKGVTLNRAEELRAVAAALTVHTAAAAEVGADAGNESKSWVVKLNDDGHATAMAVSGGTKSFVVTPKAGRLSVTPVGGGPTADIAAPSGWDSSSPLLRIDCGDGIGAKVVQFLGRAGDSAYCAYRLSVCGASLKATVLSAKEHELSAHMLQPEVKDKSNLIQSPMPGTLVSVSVAVGQTIQAGQEVAVVEAMKMQNVLRSPRAGVVKALHASVGSSLTVDELIVTLEATAK